MNDDQAKYISNGSTIIISFNFI